eukprot:CAMPEP_0180786270 /NCGR_PEP_ID=MMETSP1038_2-20121128/50705_1 /TAXON_ID=632150 /ORGANISM="Azadinium spinosum, Strain 3D9" /LENGTH=153 /DNA_ID=CAMNT_0022823369 /DNA_START=239 /DNA_END=701 /DNA_ORIENTATION=+
MPSQAQDAEIVFCAHDALELLPLQGHRVSLVERVSQGPSPQPGLPPSGGSVGRAMDLHGRVGKRDCTAARGSPWPTAAAGLVAARRSATRSAFSVHPDEFKPKCKTWALSSRTGRVERHLQTRSLARRRGLRKSAMPPRAAPLAPAPGVRAEH